MATEEEAQAYRLYRQSFNGDEKVRRDALAEFTALLGEHIGVPYALRAIDGYLVLTIYNRERDDRIHKGIPGLLRQYIGVLQVVDPGTKIVVHVVYNPTEKLYVGRGIWPDEETWAAVPEGERKTQWGHLLSEEGQGDGFNPQVSA